MIEEDEHRERDRDEDAVQGPEQHDSGGGGQRPPELPIPNASNGGEFRGLKRLCQSGRGGGVAKQILQ